MDVKAIETEYNGYKFRSRLEARWAVFFDAAGIKYEYEAYGFEGINWGDELPRKYLPDFYLPQFDVFVEVKPSKEKLYQEQEKISSCIDFNATPISEKGLLILGQIPHYEPFEDEFIVPKFAFLTWNKGVDSNLASFIFDDLDKLRLITEFTGEVSSAPELPYIVVNDDLYLMANHAAAYMENMLWTVNRNNVLSTAVKLSPCFKKARQARFEHGETPKAEKII